MNHSVRKSCSVRLLFIIESWGRWYLADEVLVFPVVRGGDVDGVLQASLQVVHLTNHTSTTQHVFSSTC